jgi:ABC-2 type transport system permease protein
VTAASVPAVRGSALRAEARKLVTVRSAPLTGLAAVVGALALAGLVLASLPVTQGASVAALPPRDVLGAALLGVDLAAVATIVLGASAAGGEWATGQALPTFLLQPRRERVVLAKTAVVAGAAAVVGAAAALVCTGLAAAVLGDRGLPPDALRLAAGTVLTPVLYALVACAAGLALRSTGGGVLVALLLLALPTAAGWLGLPVALLPAAALHSLAGTAGPDELVGAPTAVLSLLGWTALALGTAIGRVRAQDV